jgi:hypothetical protein
MARVKNEESRVSGTDDFGGQARQYIFVKKQMEFFESELKTLKEKIFAHIDEEGEVDGSGNLFYEFPAEIEGVKMFQKQRRVTRKIEEGVAEQIISDKGLEDELYKTIRVVDEDALMAALYEGKLTEEEIEEMYPQKIVWALVMNKK